MSSSVTIIHPYYKITPKSIPFQYIPGLHLQEPFVFNGINQPYAVGLVWGLDARDQDVLRVYGFREGLFQERSIWVFDEKEHPHSQEGKE